MVFAAFFVLIEEKPPVVSTAVDAEAIGYPEGDAGRPGISCAADGLANAQITILIWLAEISRINASWQKHSRCSDILNLDIIDNRFKPRACFGLDAQKLDRDRRRRLDVATGAATPHTTGWADFNAADN